MKKFLKYILIIIAFLPIFVFAQTTNTPQDTTITVGIPNPTSAGDDIMSIIVAVIDNIIMPIAAVFVVMWIIYSGFKFVTAQGKPNEIQKAKQMLLWSLIGGGILLGAVGISKVVQNTINSLLN